ncbi:MAG: S1C family serine protease [bacterium]
MREKSRTIPMPIFVAIALICGATYSIAQESFDLRTAIVEVAKQVKPAVVFIDIKGESISAELFDTPGHRDIPREFQPRGVGSGVVISPDGYILTNNHVVKEAESITVRFENGETKKARIVGRDPGTDLAVLKIDPIPGMRYVKFGDSDRAEVGEWVVAIGHPRGLEQTVTVGIISGKNRRTGILGATGYEDFIQTDAAVNPGNSGGPLVNLKGEVIGINSSIFSTSGGWQGISFAIPSNMAKRISETLIKEGRVRRGQLGIYIQEITSEIAESLKLPKDTRGILISDVMPGGAADRAGIKQKDIITFYDGKRMTSAEELRNTVANTPIGKVVEVVVLRDGREITIKVKVAEKEATVER